FRDALGQLTGVWHEKPEGGIDALLVEKASGQSLPAHAFWIWSDPHAAEGAPTQTIYFRKSFELPKVPGEAVAIVNADNTHRLWVNGTEARRRNEIPWNETSVLDLRPFLRAGANTFAVEASNGGDGVNPAGLLFYARLRPEAPGETKDSSRDTMPLDFGSDASWMVTTNRVDGWEKPEFNDKAWQAASVLGPSESARW